MRYLVYSGSIILISHPKFAWVLSFSEELETNWLKERVVYCWRQPSTSPLTNPTPESSRNRNLIFTEQPKENGKQLIAEFFQKKALTFILLTSKLTTKDCDKSNNNLLLKRVESGEITARINMKTLHLFILLPTISFTNLFIHAFVWKNVAFNRPLIN